jgi:hypothetical protein
MSAYYVRIGDTIRIAFGTSNTSGAATDADSTPTVIVRQQGVDLGYSPPVTHINTAEYEASIVVSAANGFVVGKECDVRVQVAVAGVQGRDGLASFQVIARDAFGLVFEPPIIFHNEPVASKRNVKTMLFLDDAKTPAPLATVFTGTKAARKLVGSSTVFASATINYVTVGVAGNGFTIKFIADGAGTGSVTTSGNDITFHYAAGVTTAANAVAALATYFTFSGSFTGASTLASPADAFGPLKLAGGTDSALFVETVDGSANTTSAAAAGLFVNAGYDGSWVYQFTQPEANVIVDELTLRITRIADPASLDLSTKTTHCDTVIYDKTATGALGNQTTIQFVNDGAGAGTLDESAYPKILFHYASATTTNKNFEDAVVASTHLAIKAYGTPTNVLANPADTFAATNLAGGQGFQQMVYPCPVRHDGFDAIGDAAASLQYGDLVRLSIRALIAKVNDFRTGTLTFRDLTDAKNSITVTTDASGRISLVINDPT